MQIEGGGSEWVDLNRRAAERYPHPGCFSTKSVDLLENARDSFLQRAKKISKKCKEVQRSAKKCKKVQKNLKCCRCNMKMECKGDTRVY